MKKLPIILAFFTSVSTVLAQSTPRSMVILEIANGTWTTYGPGASMGAIDLLANGKYVAVIENHNGDLFANTYSNARNSYYGVSGFPTAVFDGNQATVGGSHSNSMYSTYLAKYETAIATNSPVIMDMSVTNSGLNYSATVTIHKVDIITATNLRLHFALTQSNIQYSWQGQTHLEHVNRLMLPDQNGTSVNFNSGNTVSVFYNFTIPPEYPLQDCEFVAWLQNNDAGQGAIPGSGSPSLTKWNILQGIKRGVIDLTPDFSASATNINPGEFVSFQNETIGGYIGTPETYKWYFPGATPDSSTLENPTVTYSNCGNYNATLIVSRGGQKDTLLKQSYIHVAGNCLPHFIPAWSGNPYYPMSITVVQAQVDGTDLVAGDEIGIFDGSLCVGAYKLISAINPSNPPFITVSKDDPGTPAIDGYTEGHPIVYKLWKSVANLEISSVTHTFPYAPSFAFETFVQNETAVVTLSGTSSQTLNTPLLAGWNMISFNVLPPNMNLLSILQPLVSSGTLVKVIDEAGNIIQNFPWGWVNNIGNMAVTEGYYIKVAAACTLSTIGTPAAGSTTIPLATGWNIMGYPCQNQQNALTAVQPLITAGTLIKMIDEAGNIIQYFPWGWVNNIGNLKAGEGYYIKVSGACSLTLTNTSLKTTECAQTSSNIVSHFKPPVIGNPYKPMAIAVQIDPAVYERLNEGDELGVFDGAMCVGGLAINPSHKDFAVLTAWADDPYTDVQDGFNPGAPIDWRYWNKSSDEEYTVKVQFVEGNRDFSSLGTFIGRITSLPVKSKGEESAANYLSNVIPNPINEKALVRFQLAQTAKVLIRIITPTGHTMNEICNTRYDAGLHTVDLDARNLKPGVYYVQFNAVTMQDTFNNTKKIIIAR